MEIQIAVAATPKAKSVKAPKVSKVDEELMRVCINGGMTERAVNMGNFSVANKNRSLSLTLDGKKLVGYAELMIGREDMASIYGIDAPYTSDAITKLLKWAKQRTASVPEFAVSQGEARYRMKPL